MKMHHDGVDFFCLPDNAHCLADEQLRSPEDMDACPLCPDPWKNGICTPGDCEYYTEADI